MPSPARKFFLLRVPSRSACSIVLAIGATFLFPFPLLGEEAPGAKSDPEVPVLPEKKPAFRPPVAETPEGAKPKSPEPSLPANDPTGPLPPPTLLEPGVLPEPLPPIPDYDPNRKWQHPVTSQPAIYQPANFPATFPIAAPEEGAAIPPLQFTVPNFYGGAPLAFEVSPGRRFEYGGSLGLDYTYDDNPILNDRGNRGGNPTESGLRSSLNGFLNVKFGSEQRLLLLDLRGDINYRLQQSDSPVDYNGRLGLVYTHRFYAPAMLSANVGLAYLTQPDYSQINLRPQNGASGSGGYFTANAKVDLSYRWLSELTTRTSLSTNSILYSGDSENSQTTVTVGNEVRFLTDRVTWIGEVRFEDVGYVNASERDSNTLYLLLGAEWKWGPGIQTSVRLGESIRSSELGGKSAAPYGELGVTYKPSFRNTITVSARYGYEESQVSNESLASRIGVTYSRAIGPRASASLSTNFVQNEGQGSRSNRSETLFDAALSLSYQLTERLSLSAQVSYTQNESSAEALDSNFSHTRFTISARYSF